MYYTITLHSYKSLLSYILKAVSVLFKVGRLGAQSLRYKEEIQPSF